MIKTDSKNTAEPARKTSAATPEKQAAFSTRSLLSERALLSVPIVDAANRPLSDAELQDKRCPVRFGMEMIGDKWTLLLIRDLLLRQVRRYSELQASLGDISTNILASRLKELVDKGLAERFKDPDDGKSALYLLTDKGLDLLPVLAELLRWGLKYDQFSAVPAPMAVMLETGFEEFLQLRREQLAEQRQRLVKKDDTNPRSGKRRL